MTIVAQYPNHAMTGLSGNRSRFGRNGALLLAMALLGAACVGGDSISSGAPTTLTGRPTEPTEVVAAHDDDSETDGGETGEDIVDQDASAADGESEGQAEAADDQDVALDDSETPAWLATTFSLKEVAKLNAPTTLAVRAGSSDLWVAERPGRVRLIRKDSGELVEPLVLDISDQITVNSEGGLLGMDFSADGSLLYVSYTDTDTNSVIAEYQMDGDVAQPDSERIVLRLDQPHGNHNGGQITFGPDGYLYIGFGDGGSGGDPDGHGQNRQTLLGSVLRIDPTEGPGGEPYTIPDDNPYTTNGEGLAEIWLWGVRNPWRFSFDADNGDLWVGDVGQDLSLIHI